MKTVGQLITELQKWDPDAQVLIHHENQRKLLNLGEPRLFFANNVPLSIVIPISPPQNVEFKDTKIVEIEIESE